MTLPVTEIMNIVLTMLNRKSARHLWLSTLVPEVPALKKSHMSILTTVSGVITMNRLAGTAPISRSDIAAQRNERSNATKKVNIKSLQISL